MSWEKVKLADVTEYITDGDHQPAPKSDAGVLFVKIKDIENNQVVFDNALFVPQGYYDKLPQNRKPVRGDTLYTVVGSYGIPAFVNHDTPFCFERNIALLHPNSQVVPKYLYYAVKNPVFYGYANNIANGSAQKLIPLSKLASMEISIPPIDIQKKIVDILSAYDELIENDQKQIKLLEEAAQRLYKEWFVDLRFPGYETTPITDGIPEGWQLSTVGKCTALLRRGISPKYSEEGTSVVINQKCIRQSVVDLGEARRQEKAYPAELNLIDSDTVICSTGAGTLGRVGQVFGEYPNTTFDSHVTLVRADDTIGKQYLYQFLKSKQSYLQGMGKGSTNQLELNRGTIQELPMLVPAELIRRAFEQQIQPMHDKVTALSKQIALLREARNSLLPKLMNGEIEV